MVTTIINNKKLPLDRNKTCKLNNKQAFDLTITKVEVNPIPFKKKRQTDGEY